MDFLLINSIKNGGITVGLREGYAGSMYDYKTGKVLPGNTHQVNFMSNTARTNPELFKLDLNKVKEIK